MNLTRYALLIILLVAAINNLATASGQFHGEDEVAQRWTSLQVMRLAGSDEESAADELLFYLNRSSHPFLRYILSIPGLMLLPNAEIGVRLVAVLLSIAFVYAIYQLGAQIGGTPVAVLSALWVAASGVFTWTSMAFAWSVIVLALLLCVRLLHYQPFDLRVQANRRAFTMMNLALFIAFLINTGSILFLGALCLLYAYENRPRFGLVLRRLLPFILAYGLYMLYYFVLLPLAGPTHGQFDHVLRRSGASGLNIEALWANLRGINLYFLPFVAWVVLVAAGVWLWRQQRRTLFFLLPYLLAWSFYFRIATEQYFVLGFIILVPYGVALLYRELHARLPTTAVYGLFGVVIALTGLWNYALLVRPYAVADYPYAVSDGFWADGGRRHNVIYPYTEAGRIVDAHLSAAGLFIHDLGGAFSQFYYNEDPRHQEQHTRYAGPFRAPGGDETGTCVDPYAGDELPAGVEIIVTQRDLCAAHVAQRIPVPGSEIVVFVLEAPPQP